jgi:hypothetical protein
MQAFPFAPTWGEAGFHRLGNVINSAEADRPRRSAGPRKENRKYSSDEWVK